MSGFVGSLDANACEPIGTGFNCSGGGPFYGTDLEINCWISQLQQGICSGSPSGTSWEFRDIHDNGPIWFTYYGPDVE